MTDRATVRFSNNGSVYVNAKELVCSAAFKRELADMKVIALSIKESKESKQEA